MSPVSQAASAQGLCSVSSVTVTAASEKMEEMNDGTYFFICQSYEAFHCEYVGGHTGRAAS